MFDKSKKESRILLLDHCGRIEPTDDSELKTFLDSVPYWQNAEEQIRWKEITSPKTINSKNQVVGETIMLYCLQADHV